MSSNTSGNITKLLWGISLAGLSGLAYLLYQYFFRKSSVPLLTHLPTTTTTTNNTTTLKSAVVEDVEEESDDEEEEDEDEKLPPSQKKEAQQEQDNISKELEIHQRFDTAMRLADKFIKAEEHKKAAEKLTEAINLASQLSNVTSKSLIALYNNRSAMYEKATALEDSLKDIRVLLTMDPNHSKARLRRSRIYEVQGQYEKALNDAFYCMFRDMQLQQDHGFARRVQQLTQQSSHLRAKKMISDMLSNEEKSLPSQTFLRNALEAFCDLTTWRAVLTEQSQQLSDLEEAFDSSVRRFREASEEEEKDSGLVLEVLTKGLNLVRWTLLNGDFRQGFARVKTLANDYVEVARSLMEGNEGLVNAVADLLELVGLDLQLRCAFSKSLEVYQQSLSLRPNHLFTSFKAANVHLELGDLAAAETMYDALLTLSLKDVERAWVLFHRSFLHVIRDPLTGNYPQPPEPAVTKASSDLQEALDLCEKLVADGDESAKEVFFLSLLKSVHLRTHVLGQLGVVVTDEEATQAANQEALKKAKNLHPTHESVIIMEASHLGEQGQIEEALGLVDNHKESIDQCSALCVRASVNAMQALGIMTRGDFPAANRVFVEDVIPEYEKVLSIDPQNLEVRCQFGQLRAMLGDIPGSLQLLKEAVPLVRCREEAYDIAQLLVTNEAQLVAMQEVVANNPSAMPQQS